MNPEGKKKLKTSDLKNIYFVNNEININNFLSDNLLIQIFKLLPLEERLKIESVCKDWLQLSKCSWTNVNKLEINEENKTNFYIQVAKRCGSNLNDLNIKNNLNLNYPLLLKEISKNCQNLNRFGLSTDATRDQTFCSDQDLKSLFEKNCKLSSISFYRIVLNGDCLLGLWATNIEEISIKFCHLSYGTEHNVYKFFSKLINLKKIYVETSISIDVNELVLALNMSSCEKLNEVCIITCDDLRVYELSSLLYKQKKLYKLDLSRAEVGKDFFQGLPADNIQQLFIKYNESISSCIDRFKNLTWLSCYVDDLTDGCILNLTACVNLKILIFYEIKKYSLTSYGENSFYQFQKLQCFGFRVKDVKIDNLLKIVLQFKNLELLDIKGCTFTDIGFKSIISLSNLDILNISDTVITDKQLIHVVKKLLNLTKLFIGRCMYLTEEGIKRASDLKDKRCDPHILEIYFHDF